MGTLRAALCGGTLRHSAVGEEDQLIASMTWVGGAKLSIQHWLEALTSLGGQILLLLRVNYMLTVCNQHDGAALLTTRQV